MHDRVERKLTAILYTDVAGYSRLTGQDEEGTHHLLSEFLDTITAFIEHRKGKVLHYAGDAILAEFASVVNALSCAAEIQRDLKKRNQGVPENRRMEFRIGINLGDVIVDRQEIYGDGVNVAARLESLAESGGICISRAVLEQVRTKLDLGYESLGEQKVKNISEPVQAYRVIIEPGVPGEVIGEKRSRPNRTHTLILLVVVALVGVGIWNFYLHDEEPDKIVAPAEPSIAVLPFKNLSGGLGQDYFSDGITQDIITDLSKFRDLFVIASATAFTYKDKPVKVQDVAEELGVRYILEGSVQKAENRVRINAQLVDGGTGRHVWTERFVRDLEDIFALQDEIVSSIVGILATQLDEAERDRAMGKDTDNLEAYDYVLRGREFRSRATSADNAEAQKLFSKAIELDPGYASAYVGAGLCYMDMVRFGWTASPSDALQNAQDLAQKALGIEDTNAAAHRLLGWTYLKWLKYDLARESFGRAIELNSNDADSYDALGAVELYSGHAEEAIETIQIAFRYNPTLPARSYVHLGLAYYLNAQYNDAILTMERSLVRNPDLVIHYIILAAAHAQANQSEDANRAVAEVRRRHPFFEVASFGTAFREPADREKLAQGLRKAGLE